VIFEDDTDGFLNVKRTSQRVNYEGDADGRFESFPARPASIINMQNADALGVKLAGRAEQ